MILLLLPSGPRVGKICLGIISDDKLADQKKNNTKTYGDECLPLGYLLLFVDSILQSYEPPINYKSVTSIMEPFLSAKKLALVQGKFQAVGRRCGMFLLHSRAMNSDPMVLTLLGTFTFFVRIRIMITF